MRSRGGGARVSAPASQQLFRRTVAADAAGARAARSALQPLLERLGVEPGMRDALLLAVAELVINPGQHARPPASEVEVALLRVTDRLRLELRDDGAPFADFEACWRADVADPLAESGRGLALVAAQFPTARYVPGEGGHNLLVLDAGALPAPRPRVLLVDDDAPTLRVLEHYLAQDYDVVACASAETALEVVAAQAVDLVISDIRMPGLDGVGLRRRLAAHAGTDTLPFLFLTGQPETEAEVNGLAVDDYLVKPVTAERLRSVTRRVLERSRQLRGRLDEQYGAALTARLRPSLAARLGGYRSCVRTSAAGPGGGDLLLSRATPDGQLIVLADLMGHGTDAKLHAHTLAGYLHGLLAADSARWTPATLLDAISRAFRDDALLAETLATLVAVELAEEGRVTMASAGHPPAWRISRAGCAALELSGALPGLAEDAGYEQLALVLGPGERLALYTDGLVELRGDAAAEAALVADLTGTLAAQEAAELDVAADAAWTVWRDRVGAQPEDDATLVLFERAL